MWDTLRAHHATVKDRRILSLFDDPGRAEQFSLRLGEMLFDYSKTNLDAEGRRLLIGLLDTEFCDGLERDITGLEVVVVVVDGGGGRLLGRSRCCPLYLSCRLLSV